MRLVALMIPPTTERATKTGLVPNHPWLRRYYRYVKRACELRSSVDDFVQALSLCSLEQTTLVLDAPLGARPERCTLCPTDERCSSCRRKLRAWRIASRFTEARAIHRLVCRAIRRANYEARSLASLPKDDRNHGAKRLGANDTTSLRSVASLREQSDLVALRQSELRSSILTLPSDTREAFRLRLFEVARNALTSEHRSPASTVAIYARRMVEEYNEARSERATSEARSERQTSVARSSFKSSRRAKRTSKRRASSLATTRAKRTSK